MKAMVVHELGGPDVLRLEDVEVPAPAPGEVLVRVLAVAGTEHAGVVDAVGPGVPDRSDGRRISVSVRTVG